jgi:hypothetical protein
LEWRGVACNVRGEMRGAAEVAGPKINKTGYIEYSHWKKRCFPQSPPFRTGCVVHWRSSLRGGGPSSVDLPGVYPPSSTARGRELQGSVENIGKSAKHEQLASQLYHMGTLLPEMFSYTV